MKQDQAQAFDASWTIKWDGHEYQFGQLTEGVKADYTAWIKSRALAEPYEMRADLRRADNTLDEIAFQEAKARVQNNITSMQYDWGGPLSVASLATMGGQIKLLHLLHLASGDKQEASIEEIEALLFAKNQETNDAGVVAEEGEVASLLKQIMADSVPKSRAAALAKITAAKRNSPMEASTRR